LRALAVGLLLAGTALLQPSPGAIVDQGSFTITVSGAARGRETFAIRRTSQGYQANGTVLFADRRLTPDLTTDLSGVPVSYALDARDGSGHVERVSVVRDRGFLTLRARWLEQESVRELPAAAPRRGPDSTLVGGTVLLDDDIVHQYYLVMLGRREGVVSLVIPRRRTVLPIHLERLGPDSVRIANRALRAERVRLTGDGDGDRVVWVDSAGRVLQLTMPERHLTAIRDTPPL
jgi:hypothetical protein